MNLEQVEVQCDTDGHVYFEGLKVQFPKHLRQPGKRYICDLSEALDAGGDVVKFYRAGKNSISEIVEEVVKRKRRVG